MRKSPPLTVDFEGVKNASKPSERHLKSCKLSLSNDMLWSDPYKFPFEDQINVTVLWVKIDGDNDGILHKDYDGRKEWKRGNGHCMLGVRRMADGEDVWDLDIQGGDSDNRTYCAGGYDGYIYRHYQRF